jgi:NDP-sugar pyrophosphorylase family protein
MITRSIIDFWDGKGPVLAHRHVNPTGSEGGWVADTAYVDRSCHISSDSSVGGTARVERNTCIEGYSRVTDNAHVIGSLLRDESLVRGDSLVQDAILSDSVVRDFGRVIGDRTYGKFWLYLDHCHVREYGRTPLVGVYRGMTYTGSVADMLLTIAETTI